MLHAGAFTLVTSNAFGYYRVVWCDGHAGVTQGLYPMQTISSLARHTQINSKPQVQRDDGYK